MNLESKSVIVTGGATGIGATYSAALVAAGARVVIADVQVPAGQALAERLGADGGEAVFVRTGVADEQSTRNMAKTAFDHFGGVDVLVNNAAMYAGIAAKRPF